MRFANPRVAEDLKQGKPLRLDIGSGAKPRAGFYGVDRLEAEGIDIVADLNQPLALLPDNCAEHIFSSHALEHVQDLFLLLREIQRIARPGALIELIVPHFSNPWYYSDPTHVRFFGLYTLSYFVDPDKQPHRHKVPAFAGAPRFTIDSVSIAFYRFNLLDRLLVPFLRYFVNRTPAAQDFYELRLARWFPASELRYKMRPSKATA
jgi:ubiquinone/menaquinone biosynthesis C-methylase UbiE